jgi:uncharacterized Tic20 family protein
VLNGITWLREYTSLLSKKDVKRWLILVAIIFALYFLVGSGNDWYSPLNAIFTVSRAIGWLLATGVPFVIGASLILCSDQTRNNIVEYAQTHEEVKFSYLFVSYMILISVVMVLVSFTGLAVGASASGNIAILGVFPQLVGITLLISLILTPAYSLFAIEFDSMSKSIVLGFFISIGIIVATGTPGYPMYYLEYVFFGPAHLLSALLFIAIGAYGNYSVEYYVGTIYEPIHLVTPLLVWSFYAIASYLKARRVFYDNLSRWTEGREGWLANQ